VNRERDKRSRSKEKRQWSLKTLVALSSS
jgi:hypothetical protein